MATNNLQDIRDNLKDIQGIVIRSYGKLEAACFVLLGITEAGAAKHWLGELALQIMAGQNRPADVCANIAFSYAGLQALGLNPQTLAMFSREFQEGMVTEHRQRLLGDHGENAPEWWSWGGPKTPAVHILLMLYAENETKLAEFYQAQAEKFKAAGLVEVYQKLETVKLRDDKGHFGFVDGISQPLIAGLTRSGPLANMVAAGEFILGYPNEYGQYTDRPLVDAHEDKHNLLPVDVNGSADRDFGRNGSYLVFRQLRQHVREFWQFLDKVTQNPDGSSNPADRLKLASKMVGRWPSGAPLTLTPDKDDERWRTENDFDYHHHDPSGFNCPLGSHIRRANPRDSLDPRPGSAASIEVGKRHRIIRRGRAYGPPIAASIEPEDILRGEEPIEERGLYFICLNANISRQFEFIQHTWLNNPKFAGLYNDVDPILGDHNPKDGGGCGGIFTEQAAPVRKRWTGLPQFVTVRGGGYFFLPGISAIRYLASIP